MILWAFMGLVICLYGGWLLHDIVEIVRNPELAQLELDIDAELWPIASKIFITITALLMVFGFKIFAWGLLESVIMLK
jgi:hypothetical protein